MKRHPALILFLSLSLLFSMTEIYNVTLLGFTVLTNAEKAAHFCTCKGCSHDQNDMSEEHSMQDEMHGMDRSGQNEGPSHCATNDAETGKPAICACNTSPEKEIPNLYNSLDKVALLSPAKTNRLSKKERGLFTYQNRDEYSLSKDIFHPPKTA
jgi:hypothetical protein